MTRMYRVTARRGRGECQEVRAPRTCPAVRMRRAPAPQGKSSAFLPRPSSPAPPEGGGARPGTGGPAREGGEQGGAATASAPPALLKGAARPRGDGIWVGPSLAAFSFYRRKTEVQRSAVAASGQRARK